MLLQISSGKGLAECALAVGKFMIIGSELIHLILPHKNYSPVTEYFLGFAHDKDLRAVLELCKKTMDKQVRNLEKEAVKFELALPERPPSHVYVPLDPESMQDRFIFYIIFKGIKDAIDIHIRAIIEAIRNDGLRHIFLNIRPEGEGKSRYHCVKL